MSTILRRTVGVLASLGLSCTLLVLLGLLTWLGTLEQVHTGLYEVQKKYFESFVLLHDVGPFSIPLPGANLVLSLLFVNLIVGGVVRLRRDRSTVGVLVTHLGIAFLLASGFVKMYYSNDGHVTLYEGQRASHFQSYYRWEIAILEPIGDGRAREHVVPQERFLDATGGKPVTLSSADLPFDLEIAHFTPNCEPRRKGPMFDVDVPVIDGLFLQRRAPNKEAEANIAGGYVTAVHRDGRRESAILWGAQAAPFTSKSAKAEFTIDLRRERYPMPFTLVLDEFTKEDHPRLEMPKSFASDVTVIEAGTPRSVRISMNEPLRDEGLVLYQASWGPSNARPGDPLFSTFAVVRNPADQFPLYACIVIAAGLVLHFSRKLLRHIRIESGKMRAAALLAVFVAVAPLADAQEDAARSEPWPDHVVELAASLPIQDGGRIKPLSTYADFTLLALNGKRTTTTTAGERLSATEWLLDALFYPEFAAKQPVFLVQDAAVVEALGLDIQGRKKRDRYSFAELEPGLPKLMSLAHEYAAVDPKLRTPLQSQIVFLSESVMTFVHVTRHDTLAIVPPVTSPPHAANTGAWQTPSELLARSSALETLPAAHAALLASFESLWRQGGSPAAFERELSAVHARVVEMAQARGEYEKIDLEVAYYKAQLLTWSLVGFVLAFVVAAIMWLRPQSRWLYGATSALVLAGNGFLVAAIVIRCIIRGRPPVSTLYETVIFVTAVGTLLALAAEWINRRRIAVSAAALLGMVGVFIANGYETLDKKDTMPSLVAVLDTNFWLATHVTAITVGYSAGLLAALLASIYLVSKAARIRRDDRAYYASLARMVYGVLCFGLIFATVGTILGGIWANDSWGRFWGWDPKENGALLIVLSQIVILHARMGGYLREFGVCMAAAFGGTVVAFSWWGVNLLGVGLHSYGFTSGIHTALWTYYAIQWSVVGIGALAWLQGRRRIAPAPAALAEEPVAAS